MTTTPSVGPDQLAEVAGILTTATTASNYVSKIDSIAKLLSEVMQMLSINVTRGLSDQVQSISDGMLRMRQEHDDMASQRPTIEQSTSADMSDVNILES